MQALDKHSSKKKDESLVPGQEGRWVKEKSLDGQIHPHYWTLTEMPMGKVAPDEDLSRFQDYTIVSIDAGLSQTASVARLAPNSGQVQFMDISSAELRFPTKKLSFIADEWKNDKGIKVLEKDIPAFSYNNLKIYALHVHNVYPQMVALYQSFRYKSHAWTRDCAHQSVKQVEEKRKASTRIQQHPRPPGRKQ